MKGMKTGLIFLFVCLTFSCFSEDIIISGIVFDRDSKDRIATVKIRNLKTGASVYDNLKGEFKISAHAGDQLVFSRQLYHADTINVQSNGPLAVYMSRMAIQLKEVTIRDSLRNPEERLEATKNDFTKIYGSLAYRDFLSASPGGGAGLSIDAIWNSISRSGRNAVRLQEIIQRDYQQNVIDYRFNRTFVGRVTGLKDERLTSFMLRYRPGYYTVKNTSDYEFVSIIRGNLRRFLRAPKIYTQPRLTQPLQVKS